MLEYEKDGYKIQEFSSLSEVAQYLEQTPNLYNYALTKKDRLSEGIEFYGIDNFNDVLDRLRYGDKTQTQAYIDNLKDLDTYDEIDVGIFRDIEGFAYDMGSVVNGEPECCLNFGSPEAKQSMSIYIDIGYSGFTSVQTINNRGYAIVKLINTLIAKGYILNIYIVHYITTSGGGFYAQLFKIPTDFLTLSSIAYSGTCDFFRVVSWLLTAIQMGQLSYTGSGRSKPNSNIIKAIKERGDLYIPSGYTDDRLGSCSKERAEELVLSYYNEHVEGTDNAQKSN